MVGITETAGHRALRSCDGNWTRRQPIRVTDHANASRECLSDPVLPLRYHPSRVWIPSKTLSAEYGETAPAMMWRNGRFLPYNGGAALS
jgi:hypothetical protein